MKFKKIALLAMAGTAVLAVASCGANSRCGLPPSRR